MRALVVRCHWRMRCLVDRDDGAELLGAVVFVDLAQLRLVVVVRASRRLRSQVVV